MNSRISSPAGSARAARRRTSEATPGVTRRGSPAGAADPGVSRHERSEYGTRDPATARGAPPVKDTVTDSGFFTEDLASRDPAIFGAIGDELGRQRDEIELIASENIVSRAVLQAQGSVMTNKYAEGYPGRRYYGGCQFVDVAENLAIERACQLFGAKFANVQPNSGSQANQAVFLALLKPGDTFLAMDLAAGGHLTHGAKPNMSGKWFKPVHYGVRMQDQRLDYDQVGRTGGRAQAEADHRRRLGYPAADRLRALPRDRRLGRRLPDGRHGAFRRSGRGRAASEPDAARGRRHHHHPQDPARPARRHGADQRRGDREEDQLGGLPGAAGRAADACHRREGRRLRRGAAAGVRRLCRAGRRQRQGAGRGADEGRPRHRHRRHRHPPDAGRPAAEVA